MPRYLLIIEFKWAGVCVALEVCLTLISRSMIRTLTLSKFSIRATTAGIDMVDGLCHVAKRMEWYMLLHTLLLEQTPQSIYVHGCQRAELHTGLQKSIQELYYSLLLYEIQCVCYCYRDNNMIKMLRALITLDDWKGKQASPYNCVLRDVVEGPTLLTVLN